MRSASFTLGHKKMFQLIFNYLFNVSCDKLPPSFIKRNKEQGVNFEGPLRAVPPGWTHHSFIMFILMLIICSLHMRRVQHWLSDTDAAHSLLTDSFCACLLPLPVIVIFWFPPPAAALVATQQVLEDESCSHADIWILSLCNLMTHQATIKLTDEEKVQLRHQIIRASGRVTCGKITQTLWYSAICSEEADVMRSYWAAARSTDWTSSCLSHSAVLCQLCESGHNVVMKLMHSSSACQRAKEAPLHQFPPDQLRTRVYWA